MTTFQEHRSTFAVEFEQLEGAVTRALDELDKMIASRRPGGSGWVMDAGNNVRASLTGLRRAIAALEPTPGRPLTRTPSRRPERDPDPLNVQLAEHRAGLVRTLGLVQHMPGIDPAEVRAGADAIAAAIEHFERRAIVHQPRKART